MALTPEQTVTAVRLLIPDIEAIYGDGEDEYMFTDSEIQIYLELGHGNATWAAGLASLAVGASEALVGKQIRNYETETQTAPLMREWTAKGKLLVEQGKAEVELLEDGFFEIVTPDWDETSHPEGMSHGSYRGFFPGPYQW